MDQTKPTRTFFNVVTQEEITREMTDEEYSIHLADLARGQENQSVSSEENNGN